MALVDLVMPKMGESIMEATILKWHKQPGDSIRQDETLLEIATDKVDSEVPSTSTGILEKILYKVNDIVPIGSVIATIRTSTVEPVASDREAKPGPMEASSATVHQQSEEKSSYQTSSSGHKHNGTSGRNSVPNAAASPNKNRFYSPLVLNIATNEDVSMSELENIPGTGNEGRVTKKDILQYISGRKHRVSSRSAGDFQQEEPATPLPYSREGEAADRGMTITPKDKRPDLSTYGGNVEIIEMDRMRRLIADHMVRSKHTSAHVTSFNESDVSNLVAWRERVKNDFEKREETKLTFTPLFIEAIVRCLKNYPLVNSSVDGDRIIVKKDIHLGMATSLTNGNLIVPVIKNADQFNLVGLAKQVNNLADNARNNKLRPEDTQGGTFTMTNVGTFGSLMGTPIINQPQVAILAIGVIKKRPVVIETARGDSIAIRHMMYLSLSYDHRIIDGSLGASFLTAIARELENFDPERSI